MRRREVPSEHSLASYHAFTRAHGVNRFARGLAMATLRWVIRIYFRIDHEGFDEVPAHGPVLIVSNHRSFLDPFIIGALLPHHGPVNFMAKAEMFRRPALAALAGRLGAFPVRRGEADPDALQTATTILRAGGKVMLFPEGTRYRTGGLGAPKRGAARLALRTGATVVPVVLTGTERARRRVLIRPVKITARALSPIHPEAFPPPGPEAAAQLTVQLWKPISDTWLRLGGSPEPGRRR